MKRRFEVELRGTVTLEIDDEARSDWKPEQGILTAHEDRERFIEGSDLGTALHSLAVSVGIDGRDVSRVDGWADFPEGSVQGSEPWPWNLEGWRELAPSRPTVADERGEGS